jgi:hypothetical protein
VVADSPAALFPTVRARVLALLAQVPRDLDVRARPGQDGRIAYTKDYGIEPPKDRGTIDAETQLRLGSTTR